MADRSTSRARSDSREATPDERKVSTETIGVATAKEPPPAPPRKPEPIDTDGDGLSDHAEAHLGTDPEREFTDDDLLPDGYEAKIGTDPTATDTDGDGLRDDQELFDTGTDPLNPDSDGDGLTDGEEVLTTGTDPNAVDTDGDFVTDAAEVGFGTDPGRYDRDTPEHGDFVHEQRERFEQHTETAVQQRAELGGLEHAVDTDGDGLFDDHEISIGTDPNDPDTDGDGILDGLDPDLMLDTRDTDGDGLDDATEIALGLNPDDVDTDSDDLVDGYEVEIGTDPLDPDTDGDGLVDGTEDLLGTDPHSIDTDADGVTDRVETELGLDPLDADQDGDGVVDGRARAEAAEPEARFGEGADREFLARDQPHRPSTIDATTEIPEEPDLLDDPNSFTAVVGTPDTVGAVVSAVELEVVDRASGAERDIDVDRDMGAGSLRTAADPTEGLIDS